MIHWFIYETNKSYKLDKKNQSVPKETSKLRWVGLMLHNSKNVLKLVQMYYLDMKVVSSSPYAPFNSKEWNSVITKNSKFENTPIKIQKKFYKTFTLKKIEKDELLQEKNELHKQMQLVLG